jgi:hypothetical protein
VNSVMPVGEGLLTRGFYQRLSPEQEQKKHSLKSRAPSVNETSCKHPSPGRSPGGPPTWPVSRRPCLCTGCGARSGPPPCTKRKTEPRGPPPLTGSQLSAARRQLRPAGPEASATVQLRVATLSTALAVARCLVLRVVLRALASALGSAVGSSGSTRAAAVEIEVILCSSLQLALAATVATRGAASGAGRGGVEEESSSSSSSSSSEICLYVAYTTWTVRPVRGQARFTSCSCSTLTSRLASHGGKPFAC